MDISRLGEWDRLRVVLLQPSKYGTDGYVEHFRSGFIPNCTLPHMRSLTPREINDVPLDVNVVDEWSQSDRGYLRLLQKTECPTLLALVGVQSNQLHRALDLAAFAKSRGVEHCIIGGPHPMTCDTTALQGRGISFSLAEAELVWQQILVDAIGGELRSVYGAEQRWEKTLNPPVLSPPATKELKRGIIPMIGIYPARGCPFRCNFCSVIKIAGQRMRSEPVETTIQSLLAAQRAGIKAVSVNSDNFNRHPQAKELLRAMIEEKINLALFVQCDAQMTDDQEFVELLGKAGVYQVFVGTESFDRDVLRDAQKTQNRPERYADIIKMCHANRISTHFSSIIGFPQQTKASILEHIRIKKALNPSVASFWILTPIPGTEQYEEYLKAGLITDDNLDHFDGSLSVWRHPHLSATALTDLLYYSYRAFFSLPDIVTRAIRQRWYTLPYPAYVMLPLHSIFCRYTGHLHRQPMSTGLKQTFLDRAADYRSLRREMFGFDLVPLPKSLSLTKVDEEFSRNRKVLV